MKYLILIFLLVSLLTSCKSDMETETVMPVNFAGEYSGAIDCQGELMTANGEKLPISITQLDTSNDYFVDMGDDVIFEASAKGELLTIAEQTLNEEFDFDVVTLSGTIRWISDDSFLFEFEHEVDDEGTSNCKVSLTRL